MSPKRAPALNETFVASTKVGADVLTGRVQYGLMLSSPTEIAMHEHELIVEALVNGIAEDAETHMLATLFEVRQSLRTREANLIPDAIPRDQVSGLHL